MKPKIDIDLKEWKVAARELQKTSSRSIADFINGQALNVAIQSIKATQRANKHEIETVLGTAGHSLKSVTPRKGPRKGKLTLRKGRRITKEDSFAARILGKRFEKTGRWGVKGNTMEARVRRFIAQRVASVGFLAAGWIAARSRLFGVVKKKTFKGGGRVAGVKQFGKPLGSARPARPTRLREIFALVTNNVRAHEKIEFPETGGNPSRLITKGLRRALRLATIDMKATLARRLNKDLQRFNAK